MASTASLNTTFICYVNMIQHDIVMSIDFHPSGLIGFVRKKNAQRSVRF